MSSNEVILYVDDEKLARDFYTVVLETQPTLDVPGMVEFDLGGTALGLMPTRDIVDLVPGLTAGSGQRCELYLRRQNAQDWLDRITHAGGRLVSPLAQRSWGESVGYALDLDGHVLAIAEV